MKSIEMSRFDARLPKKQKELFEYASKLAGFRSLTDFILRTVQEKAEEIVEEHNQIITSQKDQEIFFDLVFKDIKPNKKLKSAFIEYNDQVINE